MVMDSGFYGHVSTPTYRKKKKNSYGGMRNVIIRFITNIKVKNAPRIVLRVIVEVLIVDWAKNKGVFP